MSPPPPPNEAKLPGQTKQNIWVTVDLSSKQLYLALTSWTFLGHMLNRLYVIN